jgi:hypothetical protein
MKITEIILDKIADSWLYEMAMYQREAKTFVQSLSPRIVQHLVKILVTESKTNHRKWAKEINMWLRDIQEIHLKPSGKTVSADTIFRWLTTDAPHQYDEMYVQRFVKTLARDYPNDPLKPENSTVINDVLNILKRVSHDIEHKKFNSIVDYL